MEALGAGNGSLGEVGEWWGDGKEREADGEKDYDESSKTILDRAMR